MVRRSPRPRTAPRSSRCAPAPARGSSFAPRLCPRTARAAREVVQRALRGSRREDRLRGAVAVAELVHHAAVLRGFGPLVSSRADAVLGLTLLLCSERDRAG